MRVRGAIVLALVIVRGGDVVNARGWGLVVLLGALAVAWAFVAATFVQSEG